jgi:hypothetical protein
MPEVTISGILRRLELLEAKVASLIENAGAPRPPDPDSNDDDRRLPATAAAARYGVVPRTIDRWLARPELNFPRPHRVNRRRYWWLSQLRNWDRSRALKAAHVATQDLGR